jgi:hypothetical protein
MNLNARLLPESKDGASSFLKPYLVTTLRLFIIHLFNMYREGAPKGSTSSLPGRGIIS